VTGAAVKAALAVGYEGAGTVEFIADASEGLRADRIWFMEMNTRLQVEHPVTEMVTGQDLVEWQLRVASGEPLPLQQENIRLSGWAMEARLYAENPSNKFLPSTGKLEHFVLPEAKDGVRVDSGVEEGGEVTPFYDPMIAKLIAYAPTREAAARKLADACVGVEVWPVKTNAGFLVRCAAHPDFVAGDLDTSFIEARLGRLASRPDPTSSVLQSAARIFRADLDRDLSNDQTYQTWNSPWNSFNGAFGFRLNASPKGVIYLAHADVVLRVEIEPDHAAVRDEHFEPTDGETVLFDKGEAYSFTQPQYGSSSAGAEADGQLLSPMPGRIVSIGAEAGAKVIKGQAIVTLEAMKMEHALTASFDGVLAELSAKAGDQVSEGVALARIVKAD
jgi:propionyl-CoA carboxylase alpha chain/3-methylcrotonyl-CoA carboxylase alpha subunit